MSKVKNAAAVNATPAAEVAVLEQVRDEQAAKLVETTDAPVETTEEAPAADATPAAPVANTEEAPKVRKGQTYAERKARKEAIARGEVVPRGTSAAAPKGPQSVFNLGAYLKIEGATSSATPKLEEGQETTATPAAPLHPLQDGLREVQAIHTISIKRLDQPEPLVLFLYELEGIEEPIAETLLATYVARVLKPA